MYCGNCGKELSEGEVCTCTQMNETPAQGAQYAQQGYNAGYVAFPGAYYDPTEAINNSEPVEKEDVPARTDYPEGYKIKKKYVAVLLALSVGAFGIHNFYLGNSNKGLAQLLVAAVGGLFTFGIATVGVTIWATVEGVLLLTENIDKDYNGYKIQTFEEAIAKEMKKD